MTRLENPLESRPGTANDASIGDRFVDFYSHLQPKLGAWCQHRDFR